MSDRIEKLQAKKLVSVCIPTHDGKVCWETMFQLREEEMLFDALDLPWRLEPLVIAGCSLIGRARSKNVEAALERGAHAIMWIDSDMNWASGAIARLLAHDKDVVGAACPRKVTPLQWNVSWPEDGPSEPDEKGLREVRTIGTGFLLVKRHVFDVMRSIYPANSETTFQDGTYAYYSAPGAWGEDTFFCHQWRKAGGRMWVDPEITMQHVIAPEWSVKGKFADWLAEQAGAAAAVAAE